MAKVTLKQNGNIEVKAGALAPMIIGTWHYVDLWAENGGSRDKSGNKLVRAYWEATLKKGWPFLIAYTRKELVDIIKNNI
jgi:hypothetical protein